MPVVTALDKIKVGEYISEGQRKGIDLSACDFKHVDRSCYTMLQASLQTILDAVESSAKARNVPVAPTPEPPRQTAAAQAAVLTTTSFHHTSVGND